MANKYELRGVSASKTDVHKAIKNLDKGLFPNAFCKILPDYLTKDEDYCTIMHADTAGTKSSLAYIYWKETGDLSVWEGIVQDAMVMNLDDMACSGCMDDLIISATLGRNKKLVTGDVVSRIINYAEEFVEKMRDHGVSLHLAGGETADVGDIVRTADVGYTVFGRLKRKNVITIEPKPGDLVVGLASYGKSSYEQTYNSGIGCNGLTSARHDIFSKYYMEKYPESFDPNMPQELCYAGKRRVEEKIVIDGVETDYGKLVLSPTRTYLPVLRKILDNIAKTKINGIVHNTGGGQYKINHFIADGIEIVKDNLLPIPPLFKIIHEDTGATYEEMFHVFNMGTRLEFYVPDEATAQEIISISKSFDIDSQIIGRVVSAKDSGVRIEHQGDTYYQAASRH